MDPDRETILLIKGAIAELPEDQRARCDEIANQIRQLSAEPVGMLALALVGAEMQAKA